MQFPDPAGGFPTGGGPVPGGPVPVGPMPGGAMAGRGSVPHARRAAGQFWRALAASLAVLAGTALLGVVGGFIWAVVAPRAALVMVGHGVADVVNAETNAFIAADGWYCLICLAGGVISGLLGHWLAVRRHGPAAMAAVLVGALAAALITLWIGDQSGLGTFHHQLATLPVGANFRAQLALGSRAAIAFWPLAAGLTAGSIELTAALRDRRLATADILTRAPRAYRGPAPGVLRDGPPGPG